MSLKNQNQNSTTSASSLHPLSSEMERRILKEASDENKDTMVSLDQGGYLGIKQYFMSLI